MPSHTLQKFSSSSSSFVCLWCVFTFVPLGGEAEAAEAANGALLFEAAEAAPSLERVLRN